MGKIFQAIENEQNHYNWLITDCVCYPQNRKFEELFAQEYVWISGEQFTEIIQQEDFKFIWGVFSGFSKEITLEEVIQHNLPLADGYKGFWVNNVSIQNPLANIEIVAWDSTLTLFISRDEDLIHKFRCSFPLSEDLSAQNTRNNSEITHIEDLIIRELVNRHIDINEKTLYMKYSIWNKLYSNRKILVKDKDVLHYINQILSKFQ